MRYRAALAQRAFVDSLAFYGWGRKTVFLIVGPLVVGVVLRFAIDPDAVRPLVVSGVFGIAVTVVLFLLVLLWHLFVSSSRMHGEQAAEIGTLQAQLETRTKSNNIAELLLARYLAGEAILNTPQRRESQAVDAQYWHQETLRLLEPVLSRHEFVAYQTAVIGQSEPDESLDGILNPYTFNPTQELAAHGGRLKKLRAMMMRFYSTDEPNHQPDS